MRRTDHRPGKAFLEEFFLLGGVYEFTFRLEALLNVCAMISHKGKSILPLLAYKGVLTHKASSYLTFASHCPLTTAHHLINFDARPTTET